MPTRLTRSDFVASLENKRIPIDDASGQLRTALGKADLNGSRDVAGPEEARRLFREIDRFDSNGDLASIRSHDGTAPTTAGALAALAHELARPDLRRSLWREEQSAALRGKQVSLDELPDEVRSQVQAADVNGDGRIAGYAERARAWAQVDDLDSDGDRGTIQSVDVDGVETAAGHAARALREAAVDDPNAGGLEESVVSWTPSPQGLATARASGVGQRAFSEVPEHAEMYRQAAELTGVPPQILAALHGNESNFGTSTTSTRGPESGFGLDDRWVTTSWGNQQLAQHGLGAWQRGEDTPTGRLQAAVIAGEHFKRMAGYVNVAVGPGMSQHDLAGAITAFTTGIDAGEAAHGRGTSWMLDPSDANPHPLHPGGTVRTRRGTIRVNPSRKPGLLRWDTLLPLVEEALRASGIG